tara:strand:- start:230 stop:475 length:246 start_codon:yes stop_codon:yes gene_type:complete
MKGYTMTNKELADKLNALVKEYRDEPLHFKDFSYGIHDKMHGLRTFYNKQLREAWGTGNELNIAEMKSLELSNEIIANFIK